VTTAHEAIHAALADVDRLRKIVAKGKSKQVYSASELDLIKANVHTWLHTRRSVIVAALTEPSLKEPDTFYRDLLAATNRKTSRTRYLRLLKVLKRSLSTIQADKAIELSVAKPPSATPDTPPSFTSIAADAEMQQILANRWNECVACVQYNLPLAATVMMGGLLEALLVARINKLSDQSPVFKAKSAPKEKTTGTVLKLREWTLSNYIDVAHELGWISDTYKDVGEILRDYRNYIHPYKEYQHKKRITPDDSRMLWEIGKTIIRQILKP
jgi:hypothetical protein